MSAIVALCGTRSPRTLIPCHDRSIEALRRRRAEVERVVGLAMPAEPALAVAVDKVQTWALAQALRIPVPPAATVTRASEAIVQEWLP